MGDGPGVVAQFLVTLFPWSSYNEHSGKYDKFNKKYQVLYIDHVVSVEQCRTSVKRPRGGGVGVGGE